MRVATCLAFLPIWRWGPLRIPASRPSSEADPIDAQVGMLIRAIKHEKSAIGARVRKFGLAIAEIPPRLARSNQLIFLCGANRPVGCPSARREAVKRFVEELSSDHRVIFAETVFGELAKLGHSRNFLDLEDEISDIADKIIIVLESPGAFCELGAFSHKRLRKKLVIINDLKFKVQKSFINDGPIDAAAKEGAPVLWYPMAADGVHSVDGIGATFSELKKALDVKKSGRGSPVSGDISILEAKKVSLYFVHDLVLFTGPVSHEELIAFLVVAFERKNYDMLKRLLGVLRSAGLVGSFDASGEWLYESSVGTPFLEYDFNVTGLLAAFRSFHLRSQPARVGQWWTSPA